MRGVIYLFNYIHNIIPYIKYLFLKIVYNHLYDFYHATATHSSLNYWRGFYFGNCSPHFGQEKGNVVKNITIHRVGRKPHQILGQFPSSNGTLSV